MADRKGFGIEERKGVSTEEWKIKSRDNLVASWCTGSWTWKMMEDDRVGHEELLVA